MSDRNPGESLDRRALQAALAETEVSGADSAMAHPNPQTLLAYLEGELDGEKAAEIGDHLVACRACGQAAVDLGDFAGVEAEKSSSFEEPLENEFETTAAWRSLQDRLPAEPAAVAPPLAAPMGTTAGHPSWALAAGLAVACLGLLLWGGVQRRALDRAELTVAALEAAQVEVPILYLEGQVRNQTALVAEVARKAGPGRFLIVLTPPATAPDSGLVVAVIDSSEELRWSAEDLSLSDYGTLRLGLSRAQLPAGEYRLRLTNPAGELLAVYPLRLTDR